MAIPFGGLRVLTDVHCVADGEPIQVPRTWRERLCITSYHALMTQPFEPWKKTRTVIPKVPACYMIAGGTLLMHPEYLSQLQLAAGKD